MKNSRAFWFLSVIVVLALALAACGGDDDDTDTGTPPSDTPAASVATEAASGGLDLNVGPDLNPGGSDLNAATNNGTLLPGCSDPDTTDCPAPIQMQMDGSISAGGITVAFPVRYFNALTADENPEGVPIQIEPNDTYAFENGAVFQLYFAESAEQATSELTDPVSAPWTAQGLGDGVIAVERDEEQDPPVSTIIGAFPTGDERTVVLKLTVDGQYGWDLFTRVYEAMLNTLTVTSAEATLPAS
ncbi:hypothetical protein [Aggregatilinea lenta]|uniref:hypothetical protein n=1 Tax=Aggregatilinea lenta TaxID=913108 RepID=UPI000E5A9BAD|nr:hypothetical protein [Aggregatilinea lenta]